MLFHWLLALIHSRLGFWLLATGCIYFRVSTFGGIAKISQLKMTTFFCRLIECKSSTPNIVIYRKRLPSVCIAFSMSSRVSLPSRCGIGSGTT